MVCESQYIFYTDSFLCCLGDVIAHAGVCTHVYIYTHMLITVTVRVTSHGSVFSIIFQAQNMFQFFLRRDGVCGSG